MNIFEMIGETVYCATPIRLEICFVESPLGFRFNASMICTRVGVLAVDILITHSLTFATQQAPRLEASQRTVEAVADCRKATGLADRVDRRELRFSRAPVLSFELERINAAHVNDHHVRHTR